MRQLPAIPFLERGQQLMRLQARVAQQMLADIESEQARFDQHLPITQLTDVKAFQRDVIANVTSGRERLADQQLMFQLFFCRHVDNFQIFLEELVRDIASVESTILEHVKLRKADTYTPEERRERRLQQISRMNLREFRELLVQSIDFAIFTSADTAGVVGRFFDIRNLITHNNGIIDFMFAQRYPGHRQVGEVFELDRPFIERAFTALIDASTDVQMRAQQRFRLWQREPI